YHQQIARTNSHNDSKDTEKQRLLYHHPDNEALGGTHRAKNSDLARSLGDRGIHRQENHQYSDAHAKKDNPAEYGMEERRIGRHHHAEPLISVDDVISHFAVRTSKVILQLLDD